MIQGLVQSLSMDLEREPSRLTTRPMVPLRTLLTTLALFTPRQLLQFSVKFLDSPTQGIHFLDKLCGQVLIWIIGDKPFNVAVWDHYLEQFHFEGHVLELDHDASM